MWFSGGKMVESKIYHNGDKRKGFPEEKPD